MLARLVGEDVEICVNLQAKSAAVFADPHQLEQVIMNLAVNARDAMPGGGQLRIETSVREPSPSDSLLHPDVPPGRFVVLTVSDNGVGMDQDTRARIFEPFFTTKGVGQGTGLGLSMIQGIVEQSRGYIEVDSEPGQGAAFRICLPAAEELPDAPTTGVSHAELRGKATVLVVEDQAEVRRYAVDALKTYGYHVIQAESAAQAFLLCDREPERIELVVTDVIMPNVGGRELADRLAEHWPGIKVLFMSGYAGDAAMRHGVLRKGAEFLQKPFSPEQLAGKVREMLATASHYGSENTEKFPLDTDSL